MKSYQDWQKRHPAKAGLLAACAAAIRRMAPEAEVILYGSVARGEETPESDIDLLVLVPKEVTHPLERAICDQVYEIELENDQIIGTVNRLCVFLCGNCITGDSWVGFVKTFRCTFPF